MVIDVHTHMAALTRGGKTSPALINSIAFRYMRWRLGITGGRESWQDQLDAKYVQLVRESGLDRAVMLAFDAVYDLEGQLDQANTHLLLENRYAAEFCRKTPEILFGASIHPYRRDAVEELERCLKEGAVLVKWLPLTQMMDPANPRCIPLYEAMAHHGIPLLCHTGGEKTLHAPDKSVRDPAKLAEAIRRGVKVIAAHCGTHSIWGETDYLETFCRMALEHEHFYGDTAAVTLLTRNHAIRRALDDERIQRKLVHGSDWPVPAFVMPSRMGVADSCRAMCESNWMKRDLMVKRSLGFDEAYFSRAETILRMPKVISEPYLGEIEAR